MPHATAAERFLRPADLEGEPLRPERGKPGGRGGHRAVHAGHGRRCAAWPNPFDIEQAMPASASYLGRIEDAASAISASPPPPTMPARTASRAGCPPAASCRSRPRTTCSTSWASRPTISPTPAMPGTIRPLDPKLTFAEACRNAAGDRCRDHRRWRRSTSSPGASRSPAISGARRRSGQWQRDRRRFRRCLPAMSRWSAGCARRAAGAASMRCASAPTTAPRPTDLPARCRAPAAPACVLRNQTLVARRIPISCGASATKAGLRRRR